MDIDTKINEGNSKDKLSLKITSTTVEVEKVFSSDINRSTANIRKQSEFKGYAVNLISIKSCPIIKSVLEDSHNPNLRVTMPYIDGIVATDFALNAGFKLAKNLKSIVTIYLKDILLSSVDTDFPKLVYLEKLNSIKDVSPDRFSEYTYFAEKLIERNKGRHLSGNCHGDLTLSNIICESENIFYLIDFLQTFDESPLQDMSKLLQEKKYGWSFRKSKNPVANRGRIFCQKSIPDPYDLLPVEYHESLRICEVLTLLRIIPYLTDKQTTAWLENSLKQFIKEYHS
jgi:hypothetical protein